MIGSSSRRLRKAVFSNTSFDRRLHKFVGISGSDHPNGVRALVEERGPSGNRFWSCCNGPLSLFRAGATDYAILWLSWSTFYKTQPRPTLKGSMPTRR